MHVATSPTTISPDTAARTVRWRRSRRTTAILGLIASLSSSLAMLVDDSSAAIPANDSFSSGLIISSAAGTVEGSNVDATIEPGEAANPTDKTVWYRWTAPESGPTTLNLRDAGFDTVLGVLTGTSVGSLTHVASNDDANGTEQSKLTFTATAGHTYRIVVKGWYGAAGPFVLEWAQNPPPNDDFATATSLAQASGVDGHPSYRATAEPGEPAHHGLAPKHTLWYAWTAPASGMAVLNTHGSSSDTVLAIYTGASITTLTKIASNNDFNGSPDARVAFPVTSGTTYRIVTGSVATGGGNADLQWSIDPPANDDFANARLVSGLYGTSAATTVRATTEPDEPYHGDNSVWFRWAPPTSGPAVVRAYTPVESVTVYTGASVGTAEPVAHDTLGEAPFDAVAGTVYHIAVATGSTSSEATAFTLEYVLGRCNGLDATYFWRRDQQGTTGAGDDVIVGSTGPDAIDGGGGNDTICGLSGNDAITGAAGSDKVYGGLGNDVFKEDGAPNGADRLDGEGGIDTATYAGRGSAVKLSLDASANDGATGEGDFVLATVERLIGGSGADTLTGSAAANILTGNGGADTLVGGAGADSLFGGAGMDALKLADGLGSDHGDGGADRDTATLDAGDTLVNVP